MSDQTFKWFFIAAFSLLLIYPAYYNGYPFVYSDTGTYIRSGYELVVPDDRPIFYGLFIRYLGFGTSLWISLLFQSFFVAFTITEFILLLAQHALLKRATLVFTGLGLLAFSALPAFTSFLIPDIFSAVCVMLFALLVCKPMRKTIFFLVLLALGFAIGTHLSNLLTFSLISCCLLLYVWKFTYGIIRRQAITTSVFVIVLWVVFPGINAMFGYGFRMSKASSVFLTAKLVETGHVKRYLNEAPDAKDCFLYPYRDSLPQSAGLFLWSANSPLQKNGSWTQSYEPCRKVVNDIVFNSVYFPELLKLSARDTWNQLLRNRYGVDFMPYDSLMPPADQVKWHFKNDWNSYLGSKQNTASLGIDYVAKSHVQNILILLSLGITLMGLFFIQDQNGLIAPSVLIIGCILANAFTSSVFSTIADRYHSRVSWLLLLPGIIILLNVIFVQIKKKQHAR